MTRLPPVTTVLADDLTGACEVAGLAHRRGLDVGVALVARASGHVPAFLVVNTETRLARSSEAGRIVSAWMDEPAVRSRGGALFKKTDSVLRGCVASELEAIARRTGLRRIVLVPANPGLGRVVKDGHYFVNDTPLDQTPFAADPTHPAHTASVIDLVGAVPGFRAYSLNATCELPREGLVIGDAESPADLVAWARRLESDTLAAGSAAFFDAVLATQRAELGEAGEKRATPPECPEPLLLVSGTTAPAQKDLLDAAHRRGLPVCPLRLPFPGGANPVLSQAAKFLSTTRRAYLYPAGTHEPGPAVAAAIRTELSTMVRTLVARCGVRHLVIEGGATGAAIGDLLGWHSFRVIGEWSPGIVTVEPDANPGVYVTLKPGSYPWPDALHATLFGTPPVRP